MKLNYYLKKFLLKPSYKDVDDLQNVATFEPKYRSAVSFLEIEKFRAAYYEFKKIPNSYKDTKDFAKNSLRSRFTNHWLDEF